MARRDWVPDKDPALAELTANLADRIGRSPDDFDLSPEQATGYANAQADFAHALKVANNPETHGTRTIFLKNQAKKKLVKLTRELGRQINNLMKVTDEQRQALGLPIHSTTRTPVGRPTHQPVVSIERTRGRTVLGKITGPTGRRGRPAGVESIVVFMHAGPTPPDSIDGWTYADTASRSTFELAFGPSETGDTAWLTAYYLNARGEAGPAATAVSVALPAGSPMPKERDEQQPLQIAA